MSEYLSRFEALSAAEDFFAFLGVPFDPRVVGVKRLHILKRFNERLAKLDTAGLDEDALRAGHTAALAAAYDEFLTVEPRDAKLFKVFRQGRAFVPLTEIGR